jgi:CheY-like chemotaxis protein
MKILVIEDNESFSLMLCAALREAGYEVDSALSGKEGIKAALHWLPDLIMLDYQLGDMTGYDVALGIKCMQATAGIPFILLSSMADDQLLANAFRKLPNYRAALLKTQPTADILAAAARTLAA